MVIHASSPIRRVEFGGSVSGCHHTNQSIVGILYTQIDGSILYVYIYIYIHIHIYIIYMYNIVT